MNTVLTIPNFETNIPPWATESPPGLSLAPTLILKRVLVVDDDPLVRSSLASVLECDGYDVYGAADGPAAVECTVRHEPDLVLLDLSMPTMDGWSTFVNLEQVRPLIPVIIITARPHQYKHAVRLGVDAFMEKPLSIPILLRAIRNLTHEPEGRRTRRVISPDFVTLHLRSDISEAAQT